MGKLVAVVGNTGAGKTALTLRLCQVLPLMHGLEQHAERPFQALFATDLRRYALANQIDYLLLRAEQEAAIRRGSVIGIQDGGLDEDFYVFTQFFYQQGYLTPDEYRLCQRLYTQIRQTQPPPDLIIRLSVPFDLLVQRHRQRNRTLEIATVDDLVRLESLLDEWLAHTPALPLLTIDASPDDLTFAGCLPQLVAAIQALLDP